MDIVGKIARFQHTNRVDDPWNGTLVEVIRCVQKGWYEVRPATGGHYGSTLAMREELTLEEGS